MKIDRIQLDHGAGGRASHELVARAFLPALENPILAELNDAAAVTLQGLRLAMTTDSYVVDPIFFPGGNRSEEHTSELPFKLFQGVPPCMAGTSRFCE